MKSILKFTIPALFVVFGFAASFAVDIGQVESELAGEGATGWIHGAVESQELFVFSYRNPNDFFDSQNFSLVPANDSVRSQMISLKRHDRVRVKGSFLPNPSPQKHIEVTSIEVLKAYDPSEKAGDYQHDAKIPEELLSTDKAMFLVHAITGGGRVMVVEFKDSVVPVFVRNSALTKDLSRNDLVELKYTIQASPDRPVHLRLKERETDAVRVIESIQDFHCREADREGALVMFPKSPDIVFNVFAIQQELPGGLKRQFTLVNFEDPNAFDRIRQALQDAWDRYPGAFVNGRNKLVNKRIRVRAKGLFNQVDPNQANPQILLTDETSLTILEN